VCTLQRCQTTMINNNTIKRDTSQHKSKRGSQQSDDRSRLLIWQIAQQIKQRFGCWRRNAINYHTDATREQAQRVTNKERFNTIEEPRVTLTISRRYSHGQGRTEGIIRDNKESTRRWFNRSAKDTEGVCKLGFNILWVFNAKQMFCFLFLTWIF
jgi:hypothetical protein